MAEHCLHSAKAFSVSHTAPEDRLPRKKYMGVCRCWSATTSTMMRMFLTTATE